MLDDLFKKGQERYRSLRLFGPVLDDFDDWLCQQGYGYSTRQQYVKRCASIEKYFWKRKQRNLAVLTPEAMRRCWEYFKRRTVGLHHTVTCLQRFLQDRRLLSVDGAPQPSTRFGTVLSAYCKYLTEVRGLAPATIQGNCWRASEFLTTLQQHNVGFCLVDLTREQIERYITAVSPRFGRRTLKKVVAQIRGFLRFLAMQSEAPVGLDSQVDTPLVYRLEQLPRTLPWDTVCAFLESIDRTKVNGLRDYAMFLLIVTYGLRASDVAGLKLEDIDWRAGEILINQCKTGHPLLLPLTDPVGEALLAYLRAGRPRSCRRELFLTVRAPISPMNGTSVGMVYRARVRRSTLDIPFQGVHCLRHSYAVHLLREGMSLKSIGDVLGHRSTESTCVYLRLDLDDLRDVALPLPPLSHQEARS